MKYHEHKKYFETAYKTGSDAWTHLPMEDRGLKLKEELPKGGLILDIGSGRGIFAKNLAEAGFKVIGIDFEGGIVNSANKEVKNWGFEGKMKFIESSALDIPLTDASFDGACDFGLFENLHKEDWAQYANEVTRVLKPGGFYLSVVSSRETPNFFGFSPKNSVDGEVEKYGVHYHFFEKEEMQAIFAGKLQIISQQTISAKNKEERYYLETLFKKPFDIPQSKPL